MRMNNGKSIGSVLFQSIRSLYQYNGQYKHKAPHGYGRDTKCDGDVFDGIWKSGLMVEGVVTTKLGALHREVYDI